MFLDPARIHSARHVLRGGDPRCRHTATALNRRHALIGASVLALGVATGCRTEAGRPEPSTQGRTVQTSDGEIVVPQEPQRVVVTDIYLVSTLYDLGLRPVGIPGGLIGSGALAPEVEEWIGDEVVEIGLAGEINREAVLALGPDLVIDQFYPEATEGLVEAAPVAFFDWRNTGATWREQETRVAEVLNRGSQLAERDQTFRARIDELVENHANAWELTWGVFAGSASGDWILGAVLVEVLDELGVAKVDGLSGNYVTQSREQLGILREADVLLHPELFSGEPPQPTAELIATDQFAALPAAEDGHVFGIRFTGVSCYFHALAALDELEAIAAQL